MHMLKKSESSSEEERFWNMIFKEGDKERMCMISEALEEEEILHNELANYENESCFCEICLENKEGWHMIKNAKCYHSFCDECITNYIIAKIQDNARDIKCPSVNCKAMLNSKPLRLMINDAVLVKWDELQCWSLIRNSTKIYCPFRDCSAMLVNDSEEFIRKVKCVACSRSFCAQCSVSWHMGLSCKVFQKLRWKNGGKDDKMVKNLAKANNWQKCPQCMMYVEKTDGCVHMNCRCTYQFCYKCGLKWSKSHACR